MMINKPIAIQHRPVRESLSYSQETPLALDLRAGFYLFVASIPMETYQIFNRFSIPKLLALVFIIIIAVRGKWFLGMPPKPFYFFLANYAFIAFSIQWINPFFYSQWKTRIFQIVQLLLLYWVSSYLFASKKLLIGALATYSYTLIGLLMLVELKVPGFSMSEGEKIYGERVSLGVTDPNAMTYMIGLAFIFFVHKIIQRYSLKKGIDKIHLVLLLFILYEIISLASRGGEIAILSAMIVYIVLYPNKIIKKKVFLILTAILVLLTVGTIVNQLTSERWKETIVEGSMSGREKIWPAAIEMIKRKPILGYGIEENLYILGAYTGKERRDPHSSFLWVLTEVGLLGGLPYIIGFLYCGYLAFINRKKEYGFVIFSIFVLCLVSNNSFSAMFLKLTWLILAIATSLSLRKD